MNIRLYEPSDRNSWDNYVSAHPKSTNCHLAGWKDVIERTYRHKGHYLLAQQDLKVVGVLPLVEIKSCLFGHQVVSMPFLNYGGVLADDEEVEKSLVFEAVELSRRLKAGALEMRYLDPVSFLSSNNGGALMNISVKTEKVRMLMELPASSEILLKSFKAKLRSQINKPIKEGMEAIVGGVELVEEFYRVFCVNMHDLGSPVHSKALFRNIAAGFESNARIVTVRYRGQTVAAALIICFRDTVEVPWASSLREYNSLSPNMLLYWSLLSYACDKGYRYFDFGRSTTGEGTARFKEQWGAKSHPLFWYTSGVVSDKCKGARNKSRNNRELAASVWQRVPLFIANAVGPRIRGGISL